MKIDANNDHAAIAFTAGVDGPRQVELFQLGGECGVLDVTIQLFDAEHFAHHFWRSSLGADYRRSLSSNIVLPHGTYQLKVTSLQPMLANDCRIMASIISRPHQLKESALASQGRYLINGSDPQPEIGLNPELMRSLAIKDYGSIVDLQSIRVKDLVEVYDAGVKDSSGPRSNVLNMLSKYCQNQRNENHYGDGIVSGNRELAKLELSVWAKSAIAYASYLSGSFNNSSRDINVYCDTHIPATQDILSAVLDKNGPRMVLTGNIGKASFDRFALDTSDALKIDPRQLTLSVSTDSCSGTFTLAVPDYDRFFCPTSAMVSLTVQPKDAPHLAPGRAKQEVVANSFVSAVDLQRGISAVAGARVQAQVIYADGGTVRIKTLPKKGLIVRGGRDWERITVTLMQSLNAGKLQMTMVLEGLLASGLGSVLPSDAAFTRSIDNEHPVELQDFAQRLVMMLAKR